MTRAARMPSASIILLTYNQETLVGEALQSLLAQDYSPLELIVTDDASTDRTWEVIERTLAQYDGPIRIIRNRNAKNLGLVGNYMRGFELSTGELIFSAAGDDVSLPERCSASIDAWLESGEQADLIATDAYDMAVDGTLLGVKAVDALDSWTPAAWFERRPFHFGASHMATRRLVSLNPLDAQLIAEDQCLMFRALLMGGARRLASPLVKHRRSDAPAKAKPVFHEEKKRRLIRSATYGLAEALQMLADAELAGKDHLVRGQLESAAIHHRYSLQALTAPTLGEGTRLFLDSGAVPLSKRLRFYAYNHFPWLYKPGMWLKRQLRH